MNEREPVGTLAEEAAKLLAAVHVWAGDPGAVPGHDQAECQWCPLCRLVRMAKATSPDVREHLSQAAVSLALVVKGLLDDPVTTTRRETPLEKIDVTEE